MAVIFRPRYSVETMILWYRIDRIFTVLATALVWFTTNQDDTVQLQVLAHTWHVNFIAFYYYHYFFFFFYLFHNNVIFPGILKLKQQHICRLVASTRFSKITDHFHKKFGHTCAEDSDEAFLQGKWAAAGGFWQRVYWTGLNLSNWKPDMLLAFTLIFSLTWIAGMASCRRTEFRATCTFSWSQHR